MQEFVARENIKRFQAQLDGCSDPKQQAVLIELLEDEHRILGELRTERQTPKRSRPLGPTLEKLLIPSS